MPRIIRTHHSQGPNLALHRQAAGDGRVDETAAAILHAAEQDAQAVRDAAEREAQQISADAHRRMALERDSRLKSLDGELEALTGQAREQLSALVSELRSQQECLQTQLPQQILQLALAIAEKTVGAAVAVRKDLMLPLVEEALRLTHGARKLTIRLHPTSLATWEDLVRRTVAEVSDSITTQFVADESVSPGSCIVDTEFGRIDQTWETRLQRIAHELIHD